jgi:type I restriction enzyme R subunit
VFDRNNILKKDDYFENTVYEIIDKILYDMAIKSEMDDCDFIQKKVARQYLNQYHSIYGA